MEIKPLRTHPKMTKNLLDQIDTLQRTNHTSDEIASTLGITPEAVERGFDMTGCGDDVPLKEMVQCIHQIATVCARHGATDGNVNSMRSLANWVQAGMLIGDYVQAAEWTVVSGATSDPETRTELSRTIANHSF